MLSASAPPRSASSTAVARIRSRVSGGRRSGVGESGVFRASIDIGLDTVYGVGLVSGLHRRLRRRLTPNEEDDMATTTAGDRPRQRIPAWLIRSIWKLHRAL